MKTHSNFRKFEATNGLRIVSERMPEVPSVAVGIWVNSGSASEARTTRGLAHFVEHILFKGTRRRSAADIAREMDSIGGYLNAWTERESACFYAKVLAPHTEKAVDILADMVCHPALRPADIELEKGVIIEEIKSAEDNPEDWLMDLFTETLWRNNSLGSNLLGTVETVRRFNQCTIRQFMREHYRPDNLVVAAAGNLDHDEFIDWVQARLGRLQGTGAQGNSDDKPRVRANVKLVPKPTEQVYLAIGTRGYAQRVRDRIPAFVLDAILGGGCSSRLFLEIREKRGLVYGISSMCACFRAAGFFAITASATVKNIEKVARLIERELIKIKTSGISEAELRRGKEQLKGTLILSMENNTSRMLTNARSEMYFGRHISMEESIRQIDRTTSDDVVRIANELFDDRYINIAAIGPFDENKLDLGISVG